MYVTRRQRYSTIENSQEEMIRVATINRDLFQTLLFSCISRKKLRARTIRNLMAYIRNGKLYLRENHRLKCLWNWEFIPTCQSRRKVCEIQINSFIMTFNSNVRVNKQKQIKQTKQKWKWALLTLRSESIIKEPWGVFSDSGQKY